MSTRADYILQVVGAPQDRITLLAVLIAIPEYASELGVQHLDFVEGLAGHAGLLSVITKGPIGLSVHEDRAASDDMGEATDTRFIIIVFAVLPELHVTLNCVHVGHCRDIVVPVVERAVLGGSHGHNAPNGQHDPAGHDLPDCRFLGSCKFLGVYDRRGTFGVVWVGLAVPAGP